MQYFLELIEPFVGVPALTTATRTRPIQLPDARFQRRQALRRKNYRVDQIWTWAGTVDWGAVAIDIGIPVAAILVPTFIAIGLAKSERERSEATRRADLADREGERRAARADREAERKAAAAAREDERHERYRERRREAGEGVIVTLAQLISIHPGGQSMQSVLGDLRGHIGVYRAWVEPGDHSGDWLGLQHGKGMRLWLAAMGEMDECGGPKLLAPDDLIAVMDRPRRWAQNTIDTFSGWLAGDVSEQVLHAQGAEILAEESATPAAE